jgi:hypothetical protein
LKVDVVQNLIGSGVDLLEIEMGSVEDGEESNAYIDRLGLCERLNLVF